MLKKLAILYFTLIWGSAPGQVISGTVIDGSTGDPLVGASVHVKTSEETGTITDLDGTFSLQVVDTAFLIISYTGFKTYGVIAHECHDAVIEMSADQTWFDEVLVVGYGSTVRSDVTGSVAGLKADEIENLPVNSLESAVQGQVAGVFISNQSGKLGFNIDMRIRGTASINASIQPLYVVDGVVINSKDGLSFGNARINPLSDINVSDIESIDILKDASAAAIYGSRASNGVVIITTKQGHKGATLVDLDISTGWSQPTIKRKWLNASQYLEIWDEAFANVADAQGRVYGQTGEEWKDQWLSGWRDGYDTNWEDRMYNPKAGRRKVQLNVSGGSDKTRFHLSGGQTKETAIIFLNAFERLNGRLNLSHSVNDKFEFGTNFSLSATKIQEPPADNDFASPGGLISQSPVQPLYDPENSTEIFTNTFYFHAYSYLNNVDWNVNTLRTLGSVFTNIKPAKNLLIHADVGLDLLRQDWDRFYNSKVARNTGEPGGLKRSALNEVTNISTNIYATHHLKKGLYRIISTLGMSYQKVDEEGIRLHGRNFPNDDFHNISSAGEVFLGLESTTAFSILSYFGRLQYNMDDRYLLSLSSRVDGDSRFGQANRYGFFPAVSLGWILSREPAFKVNSISYLKLRGSWGVTGNTPLDHFPSLGLYERRNYANSTGIAQTQISNPDLKWEKTTQMDVGLDFGLFEDRISGQVDFYIKKTKDLLLQVNIPATSGFDSQLQNLGRMQNKGIELLINTYNLVGKLKWKSSFNFSANRNEILDINDQVVETGSFLINRAIQGHAIGVFVAPEFAGVDPANGDALYFLNTDQDDGNLDRSVTNNINEAKRVVIGDPNPKFIYGVGNTLSWKGFELYMLWQGIYGNDIYNSGGRFQLDGFGWFDNQDVRILNRWRNPGDQTNIPQVRFLQGSIESSRFIEKGNYLRLRNVQLNYKLPAKVTRLLGLRKLHCYVTVQNLITITRYQSGDPEINTDIADFDNTGNLVSGQNLFTPPQAKSFIIGLKAGF